VTKYDPAIIQTFADRLYSQARAIAVIAALLGAIIGSVGGKALGAAVDADNGGALLGTLLLGAAGFAVGQARAFSLRLQAQTALCQVQIEVNTRPR